MDILYQAKLERCLDRKNTLEQNLTKAYALIFITCCNKTMQNRIEEHLEFEATIRDDPIELLKKIKVLMHDPIHLQTQFWHPAIAMSFCTHSSAICIQSYGKFMVQLWHIFA
jgi:hypothetical protein